MMDLCWTILGALTGIFGIFFWKLSKKYQWNPLFWSGLISGLVLILFSIAWATGAVLEGIPRSASMGLLLFGFTGIILITICLKNILSNPLEDVPLEKASVKNQILEKIPGPEKQVPKRQPIEKKSIPLFQNFALYCLCLTSCGLHYRNDPEHR